MNNVLAPAQPIMVVDDEEAILYSIDTVLRMAGLNNIIVCNDSRKVMDIIARNHIGIILLDLSMPYLRGEEILSMVCSSFPEILVIIITASANEECAIRCKKYGAFDYVIKPVEESRLLTAVTRAISFHDTKRQMDL